MVGAKSSLSFLDLTTQFLNSTVIFADVLALLLLVQLDEVIHNPLVEIFTTQMSISIGRYDLEHSVVDSQQAHVKGTTTKIEDQHVLLAVFFVETIGDSSSGGLVDDSHDVEARNDAGIFRSLKLKIN